MEQTNGIFLFCGDLFLICRSTGSNNWSIPKGLSDPGENSYQAAIRELEEETGIKLNNYKHKLLAQLEPVKYTNKNKTLVSYIVEIDNSVLNQQLECQSMVKINGIKAYPECYQFNWVNVYDTDWNIIHKTQKIALNKWLQSLI